jgi:hypothetical protein
MGFGSGGSANWGKGTGEEPRTEKVSRVKVSSDRVKREVGRDRERDRRDSQSTAE